VTIRYHPRCGSNKANKKSNTCLEHAKIDLVGVTTSLPTTVL
jgi:hypothetical protein